MSTVSRMGTSLARETTLMAFRLLRRYLRYEVSGIERLLAPGAKLLVAYHGRPLAYDQCMLMVTIHERLGYLPHGIVHQAATRIPVLRQVAEGMGCVAGDGPELAEAVARGEHVLVQPGGTREGCRSFRHRYQVDWGERLGYLRLAMRYRLPIVPLAATGVDDLYLGLNDGYALGRRLGLPAGLPLWFGVGATGLWPFALPLRARVTQYVGEPLDAHLRPGLDPEDRPALLSIHRQVTAAVQRLLDDGRGLT
jgi:1-acyl-sn-glycerol-3-phosphate acyltransferase